MNLIEKLQSEMNRCRGLIKAYEEIGPVGAFGQAMIQLDISMAEKAIASGDVVRMLRALKELRECK